MARVNTTRAVNAWRNGKRCVPCASIWSNGSTVYSYKTRILWRSGGVNFLNVRKYSVTTTIHQNGIRELLSGWTELLCEVKGESVEAGEVADKWEREERAKEEVRKEQVKLRRKSTRAELRAAAQALTIAHNRLSEAKTNARLFLSQKELLFGGAAKYL